MELLVAAASAFDFAEALDDGGEQPIRIDRARLGLFARQVSTGCAYTLRDPAGRLAMIIGLYPAPGEDWAEAWFAVGPGLRANLRAALRLGREILEDIGQGAAPLVACTLVPAGSVAGDRIAALFGFEDAGEADVGSLRVRVWRRVFEAPQAEECPCPLRP